MGNKRVMTDHEHEYSQTVDDLYPYACECDYALFNEDVIAILNEHAALKREKERLEERNDVYYNEMVIGVRKWAEAHPERDDVPDGDELIVWLLDTLADTEEQRDCDNCEITGLRCPIRNEQEFTFPCEHWQPLADTQESGK